MPGRLVWLELKENGDEEGEKVGRWEEQDSGYPCEALEQGRSTVWLRSQQCHWESDCVAKSDSRVLPRRFTPCFSPQPGAALPTFLRPLG